MAAYPNNYGKDSNVAVRHCLHSNKHHDEIINSDNSALLEWREPAFVKGEDFVPRYRALPEISKIMGAGKYKAMRPLPKLR